MIMSGHYSVTALCALLLTTAAYALPQATTTGVAQPSPSADGNASTNAWVVLNGFEGCSPIQSSFIRSSFDEMNNKLMAGEFTHGQEAELKYKQIDWQSAAAVQFFGPGYKLDSARRNVLKGLAHRPVHSLEHVRCDDPKLKCPCEDEDGGLAYTSHVRDQYFDHINFCPSFFRLPKLDDAMNAAANDAILRDKLDEYRNRAQTMAHELLHVSWVGKLVGSLYYEPGWMYDQFIRVPGAGIGFAAYRSIDTKFLALSDVSLENSAINNNQNYAHYAMAQYVIKNKGFFPSASVWHSGDSPPRPPLVVDTIPDGTQYNDIFKLAANGDLRPSGCVPAQSASSSVPASSSAPTAASSSAAAAGTTSAATSPAPSA
ncbi:hypothetical protein K431DRAFT_346203 [Polychaeton citri CBS 116435]|uniref:Uncharacterized protein n=1 Tax=Polychaeton citri CBS 116435 TaxID=1314669 RepID=A0A9P4UP93_9PEZI|nr:hypothetical protein K431DRAFT_346203 [Polychaeton citri CBS 116435]